MQGNVFKQWYGNKRFTIVVIAIVTILVVTLGLAIYSYVAAYKTVINLGNVQAEVTTAPAPLQENIDLPENTTVEPASTTTEGSMKATISTNSDDAKVVINGKTVEVPASGTIHQEIPTDDSTTKVNVQIHSDSSGNSKTKSNVKLRINSSSTNTGGN